MKDAPGLTMDDREKAGSEPSSGHPEQSDKGDEMTFALPSAIGDRLKAYYNDVAAEPVPDRFLSLLERLDQAESRNADVQDKDGE
ncbi:hypothetical protein SAMN06297251_11197 [Fulvimarina manganoxydans]|uniref:Anti-sigma factor NepR domain-containing protein n=1 Tax=Fulvimarina manganoxydans TaxID=937218 RepID=A0A1W2CST7_9HYPH|nr:NepR family anti-sigma factor [Fulvimarina manganoxydans]MEE2950802.1 NepR family anti-sigma factor [Pseudomonadota bacterium]SMC87984.1 hypothetical protein SAMN06297251_11197 [Fulvimarina manganoxydans]